MRATNSLFWRVIEHLSLRINKGWKLLPKPKPIDWSEVADRIFVVGVATVTAVLWIPLYLLGCVAVWRENRKEGIKTVRS